MELNSNPRFPSHRVRFAEETPDYDISAIAKESPLEFIKDSHSNVEHKVSAKATEGCRNLRVGKKLKISANQMP